MSLRITVPVVRIWVGNAFLLVVFPTSPPGISRRQTMLRLHLLPHSRRRRYLFPRHPLELILTVSRRLGTQMHWLVAPGSAWPGEWIHQNGQKLPVMAVAVEHLRRLVLAKSLVLLLPSRLPTHDPTNLYGILDIWATLPHGAGLGRKSGGTCSCNLEMDIVGPVIVINVNNCM